LPLLSFSQIGTTEFTVDKIYPGNVWQVMTDAVAEGWDTDKLQGLRKFIMDSTQATGVVVIQHGKELFEYGNVEELSYIASCRKSVLSMLYGPYVEAGKIDLNTTIEQLDLDDIGGLLPMEKTATIRDLLTARSGVYHQASNPGDEANRALERGSVQPGRHWLNNNWDFNIAGYILEKETGRNIYDLVDSLLAKPLQTQDWKRDAQHKGGDKTKSKYLAYHMWFSTRDMARIGYLMLCNGKWNGKQIIPAEWVKLTTSIITSYKEEMDNKTAINHFAYGYLWWVWDEPNNKGVYEGAYTAIGAYGQFITVIPKLDIVVALKTNHSYGSETSTRHYLKILHEFVISLR
jgi:CubicO group peptidase (beta-lactamase class C family)